MFLNSTLDEKRFFEIKINICFKFQLALLAKYFLFLLKIDFYFSETKLDYKYCKTWTSYTYVLYCMVSFNLLSIKGSASELIMTFLFFNPIHFHSWIDNNFGCWSCTNFLKTILSAFLYYKQISYLCCITNCTRLTMTNDYYTRGFFFYQDSCCNKYMLLEVLCNFTIFFT